MAENSGLLIVGIILIVLITAGLTYYVVKGSEIPQGNQTQNLTPSGTPTITMRGDATKTVMPDLLTVGLTIETSGKSAADSQAANAEEVAKVKAALIAADVNESEMQTSSYYTNPIYNESCYNCGVVYPVYGSGSGGGSGTVDAGVSAPGSPVYPCRYEDNCSILGYTTTHVMLVESGKVNDGGKIVEAALGAGNSTSIDYIYFSLKDETRLAIEGELQAAAATNARQKADNIAKGLGAKLGKIVSVMTDYYPYYPPYVYQKGVQVQNGGSATPSVAPTEIYPSDTSLSSSITVIYELVQ